MHGTRIRLYFLSFILLSSTVLASCGGGGGDGGGPSPQPTTTVIVGSPQSDVVVRSGFNAYRASVIPGALYKISITGVSDDVDLLVYGGDNTFTNLAQCSVDNTSFIGVSPEDCIIPAAASTIYFGVDGTFLTSSATLYTLDIELLPITNLILATPHPDTTARTGAVVYSAPSVTGTAYTLSITGLNDDADLYVFGNDGSFSATAVCSPDNTAIIGTAPEDCTLTSSGGALYFIADGIFSSSASMKYTALAVAAPEFANPANEGTVGVPTAVTSDNPRAGEVGFDGTSYYAATGLTPNTRYTVSITGLTANGNLTVYDNDATFTTASSCLIPNTFFAGTFPESCTLMASGNTLYFSVAANTTSGGVADIILVEPGP
jgi:hypothetical protein